MAAKRIKLGRFSEADESFVSPKLSKKQRKETLDAFSAFSKKFRDGLTQEEKLKIQLLQLKYLMEDYLKTDSYNEVFNFGFFLKEYIGRLNKKNKEFASEINIKPTELSQLINRHRDPNEKIIVRLELHSNKNFPAVMWLKLLAKEKALELDRDNKIREVEKRNVRRRLWFSI